jgi:hypothetical protein
VYEDDVSDVDVAPVGCKVTWTCRQIMFRRNIIVISPSLTLMMKRVFLFETLVSTYEYVRLLRSVTRGLKDASFLRCIHFHAIRANKA